MKNRIAIFALPLVAAAFLFGGARRASAAPVFFSIGGETIVKAATLPAEFKNSEGTHFDLGWRYKTFSLFFCPVVTYDGTWCGYIGKSDSYLPFTDEKVVRDAVKEANITWPAEPDLGFWTNWGGKIVLLGVVAFVFIQRRTAKAAAPPADSAAPPPAPAPPAQG